MVEILKAAPSSTTTVLPYPVILNPDPTKFISVNPTPILVIISPDPGCSEAVSYTHLTLPTICSV